MLKPRNSHKQKLTWALLIAAISVSICHAQHASQPKLVADPKAADAIPAPSNALALHGIGTSARESIDFLQNGFPRGTDRAKFPAKPEEKCQLAIDAMARLSQMHSREAVPVIMQIAALNMP